MDEIGLFKQIRPKQTDLPIDGVGNMGMGFYAGMIVKPRGKNTRIVAIV
jgi:hypothetical protein